MQAWTATEPWIAYVTGVGGGKTWLGARWLVTEAAKWPRGIHLATVNTYPQARDVVIPEIQRALEELRIPYIWRSSEKVFLLRVNGGPAQVLVRSTENYNALRGLEVDRWWPDEIRDAAPAAIDVLLGRMRGRHCDRPRSLWTTTPNGFDRIYQMFAEKPDPTRRLIQAPTRSNAHNLPPGYIEQLEAAYDAWMARQELGGEFVPQGAGQVYRSFDRHVHVRPTAYDRLAKLILCVDFNVDPMAWIVAQEVKIQDPAAPGQPPPPLRVELHALDEIICRNASVFDAMSEVLQRYAGHRGGIEVHGDASGHSRAAQTTKTCYGLIAESFLAAGIPQGEHGWTILAGHSNPPVKDRVNAVNAMLRNARGETRLFIDPKCQWLRQDLEQCTWDSTGTSIDKRDAHRTHASDALGYFVHRRHRPQAFRHEPGYRPDMRARL